MTHELKVWPEYYQAIVNTEKNFEIRNEYDRHFRVGDILILREFIPEPAPKFTGREMKCLVTYVLRGMGIEDDHCCMAIEVLSHKVIQ